MKSFIDYINESSSGNYVLKHHFGKDYTLNVSDKKRLYVKFRNYLANEEGLGVEKAKTLLNTGAIYDEMGKKVKDWGDIVI